MQLIYKNKYLLVHKTSFSARLRDYAIPLAKNKPFVLLDSAGPISAINQWSFLATQPQAIMSYKDGQLSSREGKNQNPFNLLRNFFNDGRLEEWQELDFSPYMGGPIGFISYDAARYIENLPTKAKDDLELPDLYFIKPTQAFAHNLRTNELFIYQYNLEDVAETFRFPYGGLKASATFNKGDTLGFAKDVPGYKDGPSFDTNISKHDFEQAVQKVRDHIYAGDVYQVNLSQRFQMPFSGDSFSLYQKLSQINPSPFAGYLKADDFSLLSSSPERLAIMDREGYIQTRPIAGTRRRGFDQNEDEFLTGNLLVDEKERAEHIMLVDLERNDLGKVCQYETVHVDELMTTEKYSHVIHIVSNVAGRLHTNKDAFDLVKAMFPGGTITGCPKVRCMEIIEELEPTRRGAYTGSLGYFSYNGSIDFNILIRTIVQVGSRVFLQAGAGIVADSIPEREYYETISKAQALFKSLGTEFKEKQWEIMST